MLDQEQARRSPTRARAVGIFTQQDLARAVANGADLDTQRVGDYMTAAPISINENATLAEAGVLLSETRMRHAVVLRFQPPPNENAEHRAPEAELDLRHR